MEAYPDLNVRQAHIPESKFPQSADHLIVVSERTDEDDLDEEDIDLDSAYHSRSVKMDEENLNNDEQETKRKSTKKNRFVYLLRLVSTATS